jgi:hypothetical protein
MRPYKDGTMCLQIAASTFFNINNVTAFLFVTNDGIPVPGLSTKDFSFDFPIDDFNTLTNPFALNVESEPGGELFDVGPTDQSKLAPRVPGLYQVAFVPGSRPPHPLPLEFDWPTGFYMCIVTVKAQVRASQPSVVFRQGGIPRVVKPGVFVTRAASTLISFNVV